MKFLKLFDYLFEGLLFLDIFFLRMALRLCWRIEDKTGMKIRALERIFIGFWFMNALFWAKSHSYKPPFFIQIILGSGFLLTMYFNPGRIRQLVFHRAVGFILRTFVSIWLVVIGLLPPHDLESDYFYWSLNASIVILYYLFTIDTDDPPGRKRRLSLKKLKELFGKAWIPTPQPQQN